VRVNPLFLRLDNAPPCQRWREGRDSYRLDPREPINTNRYEIAAIEGKGSDTICRAFISEHHYLRTMPAARFRLGLYRGGALVGVAVYAVPGGDRIARASFPFLDRMEVVTLGRLVLLDDVEYRGESWFVRECHRRIYREGIKGVISFSDPIPRCTEAGVLVTPGHVGTVYQSLNALYTGKSKAMTKRLFRDDASEVACRSASKIRAKARGETDPKKIRSWRSAVAEYVRHGAQPPEVDGGPELQAWLDEATALTTVEFWHSGNARYVFGLDKRVRRHAVRHHDLEIKNNGANSHQYPKDVEPVVDCSALGAA